MMYSLLLLTMLFALGHGNVVAVELAQEATQKALEDAYKAQLSEVPARIYIHGSTEEQMKEAALLQSEIEKLEIDGQYVVVPRVIRVENGPKKTQLRYFKREEGEEARDLAEQLRKLIPNLELNDLSEGNLDLSFIRPRHYELWLGAQ